MLLYCLKPTVHVLFSLRQRPRPRTRPGGTGTGMCMFSNSSLQHCLPTNVNVNPGLDRDEPSCWLTWSSRLACPKLFGKQRRTPSALLSFRTKPRFAGTLAQPGVFTGIAPRHTKGVASRRTGVERRFRFRFRGKGLYTYSCRFSANTLQRGHALFKLDRLVLKKQKKASQRLQLHVAPVCAPIINVRFRFSRFVKAR